MTHFERIKGLDVRKFAEEINSIDTCKYCDYNDEKRDLCGALLAGIPYKQCCIKATVEYLNSEVKEA